MQFVTRRNEYETNIKLPFNNNTNKRRLQNVNHFVQASMGLSGSEK